MTWLKRSAWALLGLLVLLVVAAGIYAWRTFPQLDGELKTPGLAASVTVQRDGSDVTHIKARSARDAWFALGYVHAQERGWQLEFNRRVMHGELSQVLGPATLDTDKLLRTLGVMRAARAQLAGLPAEARESLQAYSDGINAFYANTSQALSPEFQILGVRPGGTSGAAWTPEDSVGWSIMMALDLGGNWGTEFARLSAAKVLSTEHLWQLFPPYPGEPPASKTDLAELYADLGVYRTGTPPTTKSIAESQDSIRANGLFDSNFSAGLRQWAADFSQSAGTVEGKGSNNWVVAGTHSASGKPLLANDPHLGLSAPAIWYFAALQAPGLNVIGATLPGLPFVVLGRTDKVAWGFTNTGPDVQDLYLEQINPANPKQYRTPDVDGQLVWADFQTRQEVIKVKNQPDVVLAVRETRHGPVLSDAQKAYAGLLDLGKYAVALRWSALDADNRTMEAGVKANQARSVDELLKAYADNHSPMQNVVMADVGGNVAYKAVGKVPLRRPDNDIMGVAPSPGWLAKYDWAGWIPASETPQAGAAQIDAKGWYASANQRITPPGYPYFMGQDWVVPYRFNRIEQLLAATPLHDMASLQKIQGDQLSLATQKLLPYLQKTVSAHPLAGAAQQQLKTFDSTIRADSSAALIFAVWADELTRGLIAPRLGPARFAAMYGKRDFRTTVEDVLLHNDAWWCAPQTCQAQSGAALTRALDRLQALYGTDVAKWQWGQAHPAISTHRPFGSVALLARFFDVTVPTGGDTYTINVGQYWANEEKMPFASRHAASLRAVYDLSNLENSQFIYQTGQSGLVFSRRYRDMSPAWAGVQYRPLRMNPPEIRHRLVMTP
ncbi:penicillin acylase family protein [Rhodoferax sediminis]|uniref:Penicillin acylase family protein n=1 Tax=Rhodoferax sediminis TaxID=2509614 RepID=A0A515DB16_9BURK|nr:penicillin acylase family protein [Rhodoferax sediminis]QDL37618.1 penicillin acylase family protein [Rhodoferax sediminis]